MLKRVQLEKLDDYFVDLRNRKNRGVYFYRVNGYNQHIHEFIQRFYELSKLNGVIVEGKLQNPSDSNLAYYGEVIGSNFQLSVGFISSSLRKWLPRMSDSQRENISCAIYDTLLDLKKAGKTNGMLKNAYVKFMCWFYYKFEQLSGHLGDEKLPKILYEGNISYYELLFMNVLSNAGCDIVLLQYNGDAEYIKIDPNSAMSINYSEPGTTSFPAGFSLKQIRQDIQDKSTVKQLYGTAPRLTNCTNAWISGKIFEDVRKDTCLRGSDNNFFYNCFCRINGAEDKVTYENELYQLQLEIKTSKRNIVIVNKPIFLPSTDEISSIRRQNYQSVTQLISGLSSNIICPASKELQSTIIKAFADILLEESKKDGNTLNKLTNRAVYLLCWLKRYQHQLFANWKYPDVACFFYMGGCESYNEALFCRFLARLPVDVLVFNPDKNHKCCLDDSVLYEINNQDSLNIEVYPENNAGIRVGTSAYHAERDLDELMYQDTGIFRNQQYASANAVILQTTYEEITILWDQEMKYRPNFSTVGQAVNMPVIFAKVCGVKNNDLSAYWVAIKNLITPDTLMVKQVPDITSTSANPAKPHVTEFIQNGRLQKARIKDHKVYQYGFLREPMQDYLLEKLQELIDQKIIKGTFVNGAEYAIIATALNLDKTTLRMIQKFDFTKKNPKLIYVVTGEAALSLEDTIRAVFLSLVGFDVVLFVPTGYQCIEKFLNRNIFEEHQIGDYVYDLQVPDFDSIPNSANSRSSWRKLIFKRGT